MGKQEYIEQIKQASDYELTMELVAIMHGQERASLLKGEEKKQMIEHLRVKWGIAAAELKARGDRNKEQRAERERAQIKRRKAVRP